MANSIIKMLIAVGLVCASSASLAHTFFFGLSDLTVNQSSQEIEIVHQFTAHDIENAIAQREQIHFSVEHAKYEELIQAYVEKRFSISLNNKQLPINWVGLEIDKSTIVVYQSVAKQNFLAGLLVKNTILVDTYPRQVNTVNYQDAAIEGSLTFNDEQRILRIDNNK